MIDRASDGSGACFSGRTRAGERAESSCGKPILHFKRAKRRQRHSRSGVTCQSVDTLLEYAIKVSPLDQDVSYLTDSLPIPEALSLSGCAVLARTCRSSGVQTAINRTLLARCEAEHGVALRVAVLLSGGVDSSLALHLLKKAGHHVTAFYLQIWFQEDFRNFWGACPWEEDLEFCQKVILLQVVRLEKLKKRKL